MFDDNKMNDAYETPDGGGGAGPPNGVEEEAGETKRSYYCYSAYPILCRPHDNTNSYITVGPGDKVYLLYTRVRGERCEGWQGYSSDGELLGDCWPEQRVLIRDITVYGDRGYMPVVKLTAVPSAALQVYSISGQLLWEKDLPHYCEPFEHTSVSGAPDGAAWIFGPHAGRDDHTDAINPQPSHVDHYDQTGKLIGAISTGGPGNSLYRVRVSPKDGRVFCALTSGEVDIYTPDGSRKEGSFRTSRLYGFTLDGNLVVAADPVAVITPTGEKVRDIKLDGFTGNIIAAAVDSKGNVYVGADDSPIGLAFVSYDAEGRFRFARGSNMDSMEVTIPSRVLDPAKMHEVQVKFESGIYVAEKDLVPSQKQGPPVFSAFLKENRGFVDWVSAEFTAVGNGTYTLKVRPGTVSGGCTLRVAKGTQPQPAHAGAVFVDFPVFVTNTSAKSAVGVFTDRNRVAFRQDETACVNVALKSREALAGAKVTLALLETGSADAALPLGEQTVDVAVGQTRTLTFSIDCSKLRPAKYWVKASLKTGAADLASGKCPLEVCEEQPETHFKIYRDQPGGGFGEGPIGSTDAVDEMSETGFNLIFHQITEGYPREREPEAQPDFEKVWSYFPEEKYTPLLEERLLEQATRRGCDMGFLIDQIFSNPTPTFPQNPVATAVHDNWREKTVKTVETVTNVTSRCASFFGYNFGHDQATAWKYWSVGEDVWNPIHEAQLAAYEKKFGARPEEDINKDPKEYWKWRRFIEYDCVTNGLRRLTTAIKAIAPAAKLGTHQTNGDASCQQHLARRYTDVLDFAFGYPTCELNNNPMARAPWTTDCARASDLDMLAFTTLRSWGRDHLTAQRRALLLSVATGSDGVGFSDWGSNPLWSKDEHHVGANYIQGFFQLLTRNGDVFTELEPADEVAILASYPEQILGEKTVGLGWWYHEPGQLDSTYTAYMYTLLSGHTPRIINEENILRGDLGRFKVLLLPRIGEHSVMEYGEDLVEEIKAFAEAGGRVICDAATTLDIPGAAKLPYVMQNSTGDANAGALPDFAMWGQCREEISQLKAILDRQSPPIASTDKYGVFIIPQCSATGAKLLFVLNYVKPPLGTGNVRAVPVTCMVNLNADAAAVYDVFEGTQVAVTEHNGARSFTADLTKLEGKLYALLPARPRRLEVAAKQNGAWLVAADGSVIDAVLPIEITITDSAGSVRLHVFRTLVGGGFTGSIPVAANDRDGRWTVSVRELATGLTGTARAAVAPPRATICTREPDVFISPDTARFFAAKRTARLLLQTPTQDALEPEANRAAAALARLGVECEVVKAAKAENVGSLREHSFLGSYPYMEGPVVAIGQPSDNFLLGYLASANVLPQRFTANYPGAGRAMVCTINGAFQGGTPSLAILAPDRSGIAAAVTALEKYTPGAARGVADYPAVQFTEADWKSSSTTRKENPIATWGPAVSSVAVSPDGSLIVAGRPCFGENVFGLSSRGRLIWKTHAACYSPEHIQIAAGRVLLGGSLRRHREWYTPEGLLWELSTVSHAYLEPEEKLACLDARGRAIWKAPNWKDAALLPDGSAFYGGWQMVSHVAGDGKVLFSQDEWEQTFTRRRQPSSIAASPDSRRVAYVMGKQVFLYDATTKKNMFQLDGIEAAAVGFAGNELACFAGGAACYFDDTGKQTFQTISLEGEGATFIQQAKARPDNRIIVYRGSNCRLVDGNGVCLWQTRLPGRVKILEALPCGDDTILRTEQGGLYSIDSKGEMKWNIENVSACAATAEEVIAGTAFGEVYKLDSEGKAVWTRRLDGVMTALPMPACPEVAIPRPTGTKVETQLPDGKGENLALKAKATLSLRGRPCDAAHLNDGKVEQPADYRYPRKRWTFMGGVANGDLVMPAEAILEWEQPVTILTVTISDVKRDKPWMCHGLLFGPNPIMQRFLDDKALDNITSSAVEFKIEAEVDGKWAPLAQVRDNMQAYHVHNFEPVTTKKVRYFVAVSSDGEFWCEEIEAYQ